MFLTKETEELYHRFSENAMKPAKLDRKTKELIAVSCSVVADCNPCIEHHYKQAQDAGASMEEIAEALAIPLAILAGSKMAKYGPVVENLQNAATK
jgi:AhpD family alkylhydroperoxidase